ncbi:calcium-binding protein [Ramlibacter sp.]|uniref:calcium-binding protein n=1 Tax=Ramlibacter sp. TaxID=1917967 RepID=UPI003D12A81B
MRSLGNADVAAYFLANSTSASYQDTLVFGAGISADGLRAARTGADLVLTFAGSAGDAVTVKNFFDGTIYSQIEQFQFADGATLTHADIATMADPGYVGLTLQGGGTLAGSRLNDSLTATGWGTELRGGDGADTLAAIVDGGVFNVSFRGGKGNDAITGSYAGDTYYFARGDGNDVIHDSVGFHPSTGVRDYFLANPTDPAYQDRLVIDMKSSELVGASRQGKDLFLDFTGDDSITIKDWYDGTGLARIELIGFTDGTLQT